MIERVDAIIYSVVNLEKSRQFYSEILGLEPRIQEPHFIGLGAGNLLIGLRERKGAEAHPRLPEVVFFVRDVHLIYEHLKAHRIEIQQTPTETDWGARKANFLDPDGNPLEIVTYTQAKW